MTFHPRRFDRAADTYAAHSAVQEGMAEALLALWPDPDGGAGTAKPGFPSGNPAVPAAPARILEIGCGTGHLTRRLRARFPAAALLVTDAAPRMLDAARASLRNDPRTEWALCDAEGRAAPPATTPPAIVTGRAPFDLVAGNALVQWFPDLAAHFRFVGVLLAGGGRYLVSGFRPDNFPELNAILAAPPFNYASFPGHDGDAVRQAAATAGLMTDNLVEDRIVTRHGSPREFLRVIRGLGSARRPEDGKPLTRDRLTFLENAYREKHAVEGGVQATWRPWYALLRKP